MPVEQTAEEKETAIAGQDQKEEAVGENNEVDSVEIRRYIEAYRMWHSGQSTMYDLCVHFNRTKHGIMCAILLSSFTDAQSLRLLS